MPAPWSAARSTVPEVNRLAIAPTFTANTSARNGFLNPFFGKRRCIGIWPPSKPKRAPWWPVRAFWPLTPLPDCSPVPEPGPRPMRLRLRVAPFGPFRVCSVVPISSFSLTRDVRVVVRFEDRYLFGRLDPDQVRNGVNHATHRHVVRQHLRFVQAGQAQCLDGPLVRLGSVDAATDQGDFQFLGHGSFLQNRRRELVANLFQTFAAHAGEVLGAAQLLKGIDGGVNDVVRVRRPDALGQDILDASDLQHGAHGAAGDDAGTGAGGT